MSERRLARTRFDWIRFGLFLLVAAAAFGNAIYRVVSHSDNVSFFFAVGALFVGVAFGTISTDPRVRRFTSWGSPHREGNPR